MENVLVCCRVSKIANANRGLFKSLPNVKTILFFLIRIVLFVKEIFLSKNIFKQT